MKEIFKLLIAYDGSAWSDAALKDLRHAAARYRKLSSSRSPTFFFPRQEKRSLPTT